MKHPVGKLLGKLFKYLPNKAQVLFTHADESAYPPLPKPIVRDTSAIKDITWSVYLHTKRCYLMSNW